MSSYDHTTGVHAGREDLRQLGVHALPVDLSTTYPLQDLASGTASLDALVAGQAEAENPVYARLLNPTVARFEKALARLERAEAAVGFASGMAALTAIVLATQESGREIVAVRPIYGTSDHLLDSGLLGNRVTWTTADQVAEAVSDETAFVLIETPANPTLELVDIADVVRQAGDVPVVVDSTFATPVLQQPLELGAAIVLHSATKFLGGHGDVIAGAVACSEARAAKLRQVRVATGALMHPWAAYLLHRSLPTLKLRVERAQQTAMDLAERLSGHPAVGRVFYPGWNDAAQRDLLERQMSGGGCILAFELEAGYRSASTVMQNVSLMMPAVSLGSVDTLIQHPAGLTHRVVSETGRESGGIGDGLLRLSVGLEEADDLWEDLSDALRATRRAPTGPSSCAEPIQGAFPSARKSA
ncbi:MULTISPECIES: PLP-dependent aspartate aminotransferase family protein [unclassified Wenzhouxiangella]|uniref:trans-sulfuration enzyme family protein n=1 Tax=unclassified Wenzhouxiangella TaxID=2613841 RepID=UPI000E32A686|nr:MULTISPECIES: aminotransferase class I/II-fold pyridoxal phosphate-dependent enzyme [unclassified Wenzhouxiangella]RFF27775.1 aminotransferase class I/II-fold pyridoxal phosphate-dependent enzyme [Wenzhouxiangella sp. 15181]RFP68404.1 aminotransferase class I/II-fold pyridoxal phosphate-dependent enzyme [Wenzhouxiangella sp. 15190]